jgi:hypothetical protein
MSNGSIKYQRFSNMSLPVLMMLVTLIVMVTMINILSIFFSLADNYQAGLGQRMRAATVGTDCDSRKTFIMLINELLTPHTVTARSGTGTLGIGWWVLKCTDC